MRLRVFGDEQVKIYSIFVETIISTTTATSAILGIVPISSPTSNYNKETMETAITTTNIS
jgi:hypothetical protein